MSNKKRTKILTAGGLPWAEDPTEARKIYMRIYREAHKSSPENAILKHLGADKKPRK